MGAGGFGAEAIWVIEDMNKSIVPSDQWEILGYVDDIAKKGSEHYDYKILGTPEEFAAELKGEQIWYFCAIGNNQARKRISSRLDQLGWQAATLIHPSVVIARKVKIGLGTYIGAGSIICPNTSIGSHVLINTRVAVGHDSIMEDFSQACPGAQINGMCKINEGVLIGSNASIFPKRSIGAWSTVGGNSQVISSVKPGITVNGVPAIKIY